MKIATLLSGALLLVLASASQAAEQASAVLLISIDGFAPDYLINADKHGLKVPVLREFIAKGAYASNVVNVSPTVTYPNHTSLVTGVAPQQHGIYTNTVFDPEGREQGAWNWYGAQIKARTLWDAAKDKGMTTASVLWPVSVAHPAIDYNVPEYWRVKQPSDDYLLDAVATPRGFLETVSAVDSLFINGGKEANAWAFDDKLADIAIAMIQEAKPEVLTVHIVGLDSAQHENGPLPTNEESRETLEHLDTTIGRIIAVEREAHPNATIAIASDHGFLPVTTTVNLNAAFSKAGLIELDANNKVKSWKAYAWNSGGSASVVLKDPNDAATLAAVDKILSELAANPDNGIAAVLRGEDAVAGGALPQASFVVDCRSGFATGGALTGNVITPTAKLTGTHGYLNTHPEMNSSFFVMGPGVQAGKELGTIDVRSIAPTLAKELDLSLPEATFPVLPLRD
jgi:predicted AlkP superfamily pyrophosphatase or phosphodiesterase